MSLCSVSLNLSVYHLQKKGKKSYQKQRKRKKISYQVFKFQVILKVNIHSPENLLAVVSELSKEIDMGMIYAE